MEHRQNSVQLPENRFILHRFNGDEIFPIKSAVMFASADEEGITLWFEVEAEPEALKRCPDTVEFGGRPRAEVAKNLKKFDLENLVGKEFRIPGTVDDDEDSCESLIYYYEHEPLRKNRIRILSRHGDRFRLRWTAVTKDINFYDGSKPLTKVEIEGEFLFKDIQKWER